MDGRLHHALSLLVSIILTTMPSALCAQAAGGIVISAEGAPPSIDFHADVNRALAYLACDSVVNDVLDTGALIEIRYTGAATRLEFHPVTSAATIHFNPRHGVRIRRNRVLSPALMLAHELGHVQRAMLGISQVKNGRYTVAEEAAVVEGIEARVARATGEPVRHSYIGTPVDVGDVTLGRTARAASVREQPSRRASP